MREKSVVVICCACEKRVTIRTGKVDRPEVWPLDMPAPVVPEDSIPHGWLSVQPSNWVSAGDFCSLGCVSTYLSYLRDWEAGE